MWNSGEPSRRDTHLVRALKKTLIMWLIRSYLRRQSRDPFLSGHKTSEATWSAGGIAQTKSGRIWRINNVDKVEKIVRMTNEDD